jgi:hypothetical protein
MLCGTWSATSTRARATAAAPDGVESCETVGHLLRLATSEVEISRSGCASIQGGGWVLFAVDAFHNEKEYEVTLKREGSDRPNCKRGADNATQSDSVVSKPLGPAETVKVLGFEPVDGAGKVARGPGEGC